MDMPTIHAELAAVSERLTREPPDDADGVMALLQLLTEVHKVATAARTLVAVHGRPLVEAALRAGIYPAELHERPYSARTVATIARQAGLPRLSPGPRPIVRRS